MNDLQKIEFEILKDFVRICDELELKYFLVCGSALGAAKYKGFIPWDDDIDVALPRKDYEIFCQKVQSMLPEHMFWQTYKTDKMYPLIFGKIRNNNTTFIEKSLAKINMNHGVYIDVFPIDGYPKEKKFQEKLEKEKKRYKLMCLCCLNVPRTWKTSIMVVVQKILGVHKKTFKLVERLEKCISQYSTEDSAVWCNHGNWQGKLEYAQYEQYGVGRWCEFEGLKVRVPEKIDEYLTQKYGDWRADLPEEKKKGHHYHCIYDAQRSYKEYIEEINNHMIRIKQ